MVGEEEKFLIGSFDMSLWFNLVVMRRGHVRMCVKTNANIGTELPICLLTKNRFDCF